MGRPYWDGLRSLYRLGQEPSKSHPGKAVRPIDDHHGSPICLKDFLSEGRNIQFLLLSQVSLGPRYRKRRAPWLGISPAALPISN
jgi:hypothetical protein